jgi:hypothetical protein
MDMFMPASFPSDDFRSFGLATINVFPATLSIEDQTDPLQRRANFNWSWQAVRFRYRSAAEASDQFRDLVRKAGDPWESDLMDEESSYNLERCVYTFFVSAISVFDSFAYSLYFLGHALRPEVFQKVAAPKQIDLKKTSDSFSSAFPTEAITAGLAALTTDERFCHLAELRNIVAHRLNGRLTVKASSMIELDGTHTMSSEERWHLQGASDSPTFDAEMLQRHLHDVTALLGPLVTAAKAFAEHCSSLAPAKISP